MSLMLAATSAAPVFAEGAEAAPAADQQVTEQQVPASDAEEQAEESQQEETQPEAEQQPSDAEPTVRSGERRTKDSAGNGRRTGKDQRK